MHGRTTSKTPYNAHCKSRKREQGQEVAIRRSHLSMYDQLNQQRAETVKKSKPEEITTRDIPNFPTTVTNPTKGILHSLHFWPTNAIFASDEVEQTALLLQSLNLSM